MQIKKLIIIFLLLTISNSLVAQSIDSEIERMKIIKGRIIDGRSGEALPLVLVTLFFSEIEYKSARADFEGYFYIHIPQDKIINDKSTLEFIIFGYNKLLMDIHFDKINSMTVSMTADSSGQITKEEYERLCIERYEYGE